MCNIYQSNPFESYADYIMTSQDEFNHQPYSGRVTQYFAITAITSAITKK